MKKLIALALVAGFLAVTTVGCGGDTGKGKTGGTTGGAGSTGGAGGGTGAGKTTGGTGK